MARQRPHDTPAGPNPAIRDLQIEVLSDAWYVLRRATFQQLQADGAQSIIDDRLTASMISQ